MPKAQRYVVERDETGWRVTDTDGIDDPLLFASSERKAAKACAAELNVAKGNEEWWDVIAT